jgi:hypothetical protein
MLTNRRSSISDIVYRRGAIELSLRFRPNADMIAAGMPINNVRVRMRKMPSYRASFTFNLDGRGAHAPGSALYVFIRSKVQYACLISLQIAVLLYRNK